eukprot:scaffold6285_cov121-Isochrysis_galbana.AAC.18
MAHRAGARPGDDLTLTARGERKPTDRDGVELTARGVARCGVKQSASADRQSMRVTLSVLCLGESMKVSRR